jgi:3-deoxy-manno-octulosonate cytidylyltransferase (CMP-KDO synthetase)
MQPFEFCAVIPARYASSRLPGKPLRQLAGRPMIEHVWRNALGSGAREALVATDDQRIFDAVERFGGRAVMTSPNHASGTDRLAEVATHLAWPDDTIVVNLQGDEPCVPGELLRQTAAALHAHAGAGIATVATPIRHVRDLFDENVVKVVLDEDGMACYFSRAPIPWVRGAFAAGASMPALPEGVPFLRHLGIYAYRAGTLRHVAAQASRAIERAESLEQLRALALGIRVHVSVIDEAPGVGVDTEDDIARVEQALARGAPGDSEGPIGAR